MCSRCQRRGRQRLATDGRRTRVNHWSWYLLFARICPRLPLETHLYGSRLQLTIFLLLRLPEPLLLPSAELSLWLHWPAVILIPTLHVTGKTCAL